MQGELYVAGVTVEVDGVLKRCQNITVVDDGVIRMKEMYDTEGKPTKVREFFWGLLELFRVRFTLMLVDRG